MSDMNACAECGYTTQNFVEFTLHIQQHEESGGEIVAIETTSKTIGEKIENETLIDLSLLTEQNNNFKEKSSNNCFNLSTLSSVNVLNSTKSSIDYSTKNNKLSDSIDKKQIETDVLNPSNNSGTFELTKTTGADTLIGNAQMLANIADLSEIFNNNTTANKQNFNCSSSVNDVKSKRLNLSNYFGKDFIASTFNSSSQRTLPTTEESKPSNFPFSVSGNLSDLTLPKVNVTERAPLNTGSISGVERARNVKTRKECPHCNFTTYMSQHMKSHLEAHERHRGQMYQCDICHTEFSQKANMHRHRTRHSGIKPYRCRFCYKEFFRKDQMQEHSMTHIKTGDDFDCPVTQCLKQFNQHQALRQHLDEDHLINASQQACCKRCALLFSNSRRLLLHYQTKHDDYQKLGSVKLIKNDNTKPLPANVSIEVGSLINNTLSRNILTDKVNDINSSSNTGATSSQHFTISAASNTLNNTNSSKTLAVNYSKRRNQRSTSSFTSKRSKPDKAFALKAGINASGSYNVDDLLKNQNYLTAMDHFTHLSSVSLSSLAKTVKPNDTIYSATAPNLRINDKIKDKLNEDHKLYGYETSDLSFNISQKTMLAPKSEANTMFNNVFNENAALVTSIALAQKALEFRNGLAAALSASNTNSSFNTKPIMSNSITSTANNSVDANSSLDYLSSLSSFSPSKNVLNESSASIPTITAINNLITNNSEINNEYLPRSKSPDYQNLIQNSYKLTTNELLMKLAGNLQNASYNKLKPSLHHHMQLWTNEANSATTTTTSSASINENVEEDEHENNQEKHKTDNGLLLNVSAGITNHHSATHSPTASSSSVSSLISINSSDRFPPLTQLDKMRSELLSIAKKGKLNLTPEKPVSSFLLNVSQNTSIERDNVLSLNLSPSSASSVLEPTHGGNDQSSNSSMLFGSSTDLQNLTGGRDSMECLHCGIIFTDQTLYLLHKGLHSESDAWRCNLCGHTCSDKYTFTTHLISFDHS